MSDGKNLSIHSQKRIYLDYNATSPVKDEVVEAMLPFFTNNWGNPSSAHFWGQQAKGAVNKSRKQVADLIGADIGEIVFTSGGTESNNLALFGILERLRGKKNHIITSSIEHSSVYNYCKHLEQNGFCVSYLPVDKHGIVSVDALNDEINDKTAIISVMLANNETGTIQPIKEIAEIAGQNEIILHTDAVQAVSKVSVNVNELEVDLLSLSGHKIYAPKGTGALYLRRGGSLPSFFKGGEQESRKRPGTENVPGIVGLGKACEIARRDFDRNTIHTQKLRDKLEKDILENIKIAKVNGHPLKRVPNTLNVSFTGTPNITLLTKLDMKGIAVSTGSACSSASKEASRSLRALGLPAAELNSSLRFSIGSGNTESDIEYTVKILMEIISATGN